MKRSIASHGTVESLRTMPAMTTAAATWRIRIRLTKPMTPKMAMATTSGITHC